MSDIDCAVLNISESGACVLVPLDAEVPETLNLAIDKVGGEHACSVVWRSGSRIGMKFRKT
jgi:hypothetical protein